MNNWLWWVMTTKKSLIKLLKLWSKSKQKKSTNTSSSSPLFLLLFRRRRLIWFFISVCNHHLYCVIINSEKAIDIFFQPRDVCVFSDVSVSCSHFTTNFFLNSNSNSIKIYIPKTLYLLPYTILQSLVVKEEVKGRKYRHYYFLSYFFFFESNSFSLMLAYITPSQFKLNLFCLYTYQFSLTSSGYTQHNKRQQQNI